MRIAIITPVLGKAGGIGQVVEEQAARLSQRGHEVTVFSPANLRPLLRFGHAAWIPSLNKKLAGFDIIHLHYPFFGSAGRVVSCKNLVITYHMDTLGQGIYRPIFRAYQKFCMPRIIRSADRVLVSSMDYAKHGDLAPLLDELKDRITELPFGVDTTRFHPAPSSAYSRELDQTKFLFVGGLDRAHYFKGVSILLRAFARLNNTTRLRLVGSGDLLEEYKKQAKRLGIEDRVEFCGRVSADDLPACYRQADCFVLPSTDRSEAFGLVLLEAQASGCPVIASDLPGVRTVFENQKTGILVKPGDEESLYQALNWMAAYPNNRKEMGQAACVRMKEKYHWDTIIDQLDAIYQSL